jgi:hypothetical protein
VYLPSIHGQRPRLQSIRRGYPIIGATSGSSSGLPPPKLASQLRPFLGILNFYRRFLPHAAATTWSSLRPHSQGISPHHLDARTPQGFWWVQGEFVTRRCTGARRPSWATCNPHRRIHFRHGSRAVETGWQRLATPRLLLQEAQSSTAEMQRLRSWTDGCLQGREAFPPHARSAPLHHLHGP